MYAEEFMCIVRSVKSAQHVKCSACFFSSWDFPVAHGGMYDVEQCISLKCHSNKGKLILIGSTLNIAHFMGCETLSSQHFDIIQMEMLFTNFFVAPIMTSVLAHISTDDVAGSGGCERVQGNGDQLKNVLSGPTAGETAGDQAAESTKIAAQLMKNPQVLAALQDKLGSIIGTPSGYIQS